MESTSILSSFIRRHSVSTCDDAVVYDVKSAIADIVAAAIAGSATPVATIASDYACEEWREGNSSILCSPCKLKPSGAAFVNGIMANALDIDDGHRLTKGHPGAVVFPAVLAAAEAYGASGRQFMDAMLVAYEIGIRAGMLSHALRPEYHCTGSWGAIGAAAGVCRVLGASEEVVGHALGIAEYHSTYSPMMRCIDVPSMLKDSIGWGSMTGVASALLAGKGFTGIPSLFAFPEAGPYLKELGTKYRIQELYFKPYPCCRWAQPAIEGMKQLRARTDIPPGSIEQIIIHTFTESSRLFRGYPNNTEEAQYNLSFPLAAFVIFGNVGPNEVLNELHHREVLGMMDRISVQVDPALVAEFPGKAISRVEVILADGRRLESDNMQARGDWDYPLSPLEKRAKYDALTIPLLGESNSERLWETIDRLEQVDDIRKLTAMMQN